MWWRGGEDGGRIVREREQVFEKFVFWNVERKGKRGKEFWKYIKKF